MNQLSKISSIILISSVLVGCGSGSSSNNSTTSESSKLTVHNVSGTGIRRVVATNQGANGNIEQSFSCSQDQFCALGDSIDPSNYASLKFFDDKGNLVSAYVFDKDIDKDNVIAVDAKTLGLFLFDQLKSKYKWNGTLLGARLSTFFYYVESPDHLPDDFEELGMYFLKENAKSPQDIDAFLSTLNSRLELNEVYQVDKPVKALAAKSIPSQSTGIVTCPAETASFSKFIRTISSLIPVKAVQGAVSGVVGVLDKGCGLAVANTIGNVRKDIQELKRKIEDIDKELKGVSYSLSSFRSDEAFKSAANSYDRILTETTSLQSDLNIYNNLLINGNAESLTELYKSTGLTDDMLNTTNSGSMGLLIANLKQTNDSLSWLSKAEVLSTIRDALDVACKNHESIPGDVVAQRLKCNVLAAKTINEFSLTYTNTVAMVKDLSVLIGNAQASPTASNKIKSIANPFANSPVWYSADVNVKNTVFNLMSSNLTDVLSKVSTTFASSFFDPYDGLGKNWLQYVMGADCKFKQSGQRDTANIKEWYAFPSKPKYLVSSCPNYSGNTELVSNFYYGQTPERLVNVLGVLVEAAKLNANYNPSGGSVLRGSNEVTGTQCPTFTLQDASNELVMNSLPTKLIDGIPYALTPYKGHSWSWTRPLTGESYTFNLDKEGSTQGTFDSYLCWNPRERNESWNTFMVSQYVVDKVTYGNLWMSLSKVDYRTVGQYSPTPYSIDRRFACVTGGCTASGNDLTFDSGLVATFQYMKNGASISIKKPTK